MSRVWLLLLVFLGAPAAASACLVQPYPGDVAQKPYEAAVEVVVTSVESGLGGFGDGWRARAEQLRIVFGQPIQPVRELVRDGDIISSCDDRPAAPKVGERWIAYLMSRNSRWMVVRMYPTDVVSPHDHRINTPAQVQLRTPPGPVVDLKPGP